MLGSWLGKSERWVFCMILVFRCVYVSFTSSRPRSWSGVESMFQVLLLTFGKIEGEFAVGFIQWALRATLGDGGLDEWCMLRCFPCLGMMLLVCTVSLVLTRAANL